MGLERLNRIHFAPETGDGSGAGVGSAHVNDGRVMDVRGDPSITNWDAPAAPASSDGAGVQRAGTERPAWAPEGLADHFIDETPEGSLAELFQAYQPLRTELSQKGTLPDDPTGYTFTPSEKVAPYADALTDDPLMEGVLGVLHRHEVTDAHAGPIVNELLELLLEGGNVPAPVDFEAEIAALVPAEAQSLDARGQRRAAGQRIQDALSWIDGAKAQGLDPDIADHLVAALGDSARGIEAIEFFIGQTRKTNPALGGKGGGGMTEADLTARLYDPRYDARSPRFDKSFADETDRLFKQHYGDKRAE